MERGMSRRGSVLAPAEKLCDVLRGRQTLGARWDRALRHAGTVMPVSLTIASGLIGSASYQATTRIAC